MMIRSVLIFLAVVATSFYFFPFFFKVLPGVNTKMMLAAVGLVVYLIRLGQERDASVNRDMFSLSLCAVLVSLAGFFSITYNNTPDYAYVTYLLSMWVWIGGAYAVVQLVKLIHGTVSVRLICNYLIAVCVIQCALALWLDMYAPAKMFVDTYIEQGQEFLNEVERIYGIGASLDVAGSRFSAVLVMIAFIVLHEHVDKKYYWAYIVAFLIITVVGSMIARTTYVGAGIALFYILYKSKIYTFQLSEECKRLWLWLLVLVVVSVPLLIMAYNAIPAVHENLRFAFEGFFNLIETGEWSIASNEKLASMYVFPETIKTWLIGDGYFSSPRDVDPMFIGKIVGGYYMGTDVGYLRFIFYFGLVGLAAISAVMCKAAFICLHKFKAESVLFFLLLGINFIVWFKVSTDIFLVFALFLMVDRKEDDAFMESIALKEQ